MAYINDLKNNWNQLAQKNAMWAVLSHKKRWDKQHFFSTGRQEVNAILTQLKKHNISFPHKRALDIGCGLGRLSRGLSQHFSEVIGVDISDIMIQKAQQLNTANNLSFEQTTGTDLSNFRANLFDFVLTDIVFQHMKNELVLSYIKDVHRVLKHGGVFVFQLPSHPQITWKGVLIKILPEKALNFLRSSMEMHPIAIDSVLTHLRAVGFEVVDIQKDDRHTHWQAYFYYVRKP